METLEQLRDRLLASFPGAVTLVSNPGPAAQHSLQLDPAHARAIATFLRDDPALRLDFCSNVTGVDWPDKEVVETTKSTVPDPAGGPPKVVEAKSKKLVPGCLEVVYHLYSMALKQGPVILRLRTGNRTDQVTLPSLTPVWRAAEFQEREVFDLFGVIFRDHPDLRRILMWDEFIDHPMRKDYVEPDDYEWEPTPHGAVHTRAKVHYPAAMAAAVPAAAGSVTAAAGAVTAAPPVSTHAPVPSNAATGSTAISTSTSGGAAPRVTPAAAVAPAAASPAPSTPAPPPPPA